MRFFFPLKAGEHSFAARILPFRHLFGTQKNMQKGQKRPRKPGIKSSGNPHDGGRISLDRPKKFGEALTKGLPRIVIIPTITPEQEPFPSFGRRHCAPRNVSNGGKLCEKSLCLGDDLLLFRKQREHYRRLEIPHGTLPLEQFLSAAGDIEHDE